MLNGYEPHFTTFGGNIYESELVRASIDAIARHISKLAVTTAGAAKPALQNKLKHGPNEFQTWSQFLYRLATILYVHNTAFIVPVYDQYGEPSGVYAVLPERCEIVQYGNDKTPYLRYKFGWGETAAIELEYCGVMTRFQYRSDMFGETNRALYPTMDLIKMQNQGIQEGVKSAATYRFMAQLSNFAKAEDLAKERKRFSEENFSRDAGGGGMLLFPNTYQNIKQIENKPFVVDADQMSVINRAVFDYFGVNEDVLTNKAYGDAWAAFYEGAVEPFAVQFAETLGRMLFTSRERAQGAGVRVASNRLQYMSTPAKIQLAKELGDRGALMVDEIRELFNYDPLPNGAGQVAPIRGEYKPTDELTTSNGGDEDASQEQ
jgi:hypothetical protein